MSIINQMLQDLQSRNVKPTNTDTGHAEEIQVIKTSFSWHDLYKKGKIEKWVLVILLIIFSYFLLHFFYLNKKPLPKKITPAQKTLPLQTASKSDLQSINIKHENALTSVIFSFKQPTIYRLEQNSAQETITIFFKNIMMTSPLPTNLDGSSIESFQSLTLGDETGIILKLKKGTILQGIMSQEHNAGNIILNLQSNDSSEFLGEMTKTLEPLSNQQLAEKAYNQSLVILNDGNIKEAVHQLQESLNLQADYLPAQQALVTLLLQQKEYDLAEKHLNQALNQRPENIELLQLKARIQLVNNNPSAALQTLQSFSPPLIGNTDYYALIAAIQQQLKNFSLAEQLYRQILMVQPNEAKWWVGLGTSLEAQQNINAAREAYQRAAMLHTLNPNLQAFVDSKLSLTNSEN